MTSAASERWGTIFGCAKLVASISVSPAATSRSISCTLRSVGTNASWDCSPSRGPTSTIWSIATRSSATPRSPSLTREEAVRRTGGALSAGGADRSHRRQRLAGEQRDRRHRRLLHPRRRERAAHLAAELAGELGQRERARHAARQRAAVLRQADGGLEQLGHLQRRADLDASTGDALAAVGELVRLAGRNGDDVAGLGDDRLAAELEAHRALDDAEALGLLRVDVQAGDLAVRRQLEVEGEQLAVALGSGGDEGDGLPRDGVRDLHSGVCHAETVPAAAW